MSEENKKEKKIDIKTIVAQNVEMKICKGNPKDGCAIIFSGKDLKSDISDEFSAIVPMDGIPALIQGLFRLGIEYQEKTGIDIGFSDVIKEKNNGELSSREV